MSLEIITGCMYSGKCYTLDTKIVNSDRKGVRISEIKENDIIYGMDDEPKKVLSVEKFNSPILEFKLEDNSVMNVTYNHIMVLFDKVQKTIVKMSAEDFAELIKNKEYSNLVSIKKPIVSGNKLDLDPWAIGFYYSKKKNTNPNVIKYLKTIPVFSFNKFFKMIKNKSFPSEIIHSDYESRVKFIRGLWHGNNRNDWIFKELKVFNSVIDILNTLCYRFICDKINLKITITEESLIIDKPAKEMIFVNFKSFRVKSNSDVIGLSVENGFIRLENGIIGHNSSKLIHEVSKYTGIGKRVFCINSVYDTRNSDDVIMTHDKITIPCAKTEFLKDVTIPYDTSVIGIDEAQFFPDLVDFVKQKLKDGFKLIVAGLDGDYKREKFGKILDLIPMADKYTKKYALCGVCLDGTPGAFTKRKSDTLNDDRQIVVGAKETYIAVCGKHF